MQPLTLDEFLGSGDAADVFSIAEPPFAGTLVAKLFRAPPTSSLEQICALANARGLSRLPGEGDEQTDGAYLPVSGPKAVVHARADGRGPVGLLVVKVDNRRFGPYEAFVRSSAVADLAVAVNAAARLADIVSWVHSPPRSYVIGDFSGTNIRVDRAGHVCIIDADSFGPLDERGNFVIEPSHSTLHFIAPEAHSDLPTRSSDTFVLATLVLEILLGGISPFIGVPNDNPSASVQDNINYVRSWLFERDAFSLPEQARDHPGRSALPGEVAQLAYETFHSGPDSRPSSEAWQQVLAKLRSGHITACGICGESKFRGMTCAFCKTGYQPDLIVAPSDYVQQLRQRPNELGRTPQSSTPAVELPSQEVLTGQTVSVLARAEAWWLSMRARMSPSDWSTVAWVVIVCLMVAVVAGLWVWLS